VQANGPGAVRGTWPPRARQAHRFRRSPARHHADATFLLAIFGVVTFRKLKIEAFPDVTNVQVMVITLYPGQAAEEIEKQVTIPVERALTGTPRVLIQRSITSFGLSQVILTFEDDVDIYWARQQVRNG
jgi:cobalt-zinc-cadmium resistance protein CzcA